MTDQQLAAQIEALEQHGVTTRRAQAAHMGLSYSAYMARLSKAGLTEKRTDLKRWMPWNFAEKHHSDPVARKLRYLARAAEGQDTRHRDKRAQAVRWASTLVEQGLDVSYSRRGGFGYKRASPRRWHLRKLLTAAQAAILAMPQFTDLQEPPN